MAIDTGAFNWLRSKVVNGFIGARSFIAYYTSDGSSVPLSALPNDNALITRSMLNIAVDGVNPYPGNIEVPIGQSGAVTTFTIHWQTDSPPMGGGTFAAQLGNSIPKYSYYDGTDSAGYTPNLPQMTVTRVSGNITTIVLAFGVASQGCIVF